VLQEVKLTDLKDSLDESWYNKSVNSYRNEREFVPLIVTKRACVSIAFRVAQMRLRA
jgi:hypothetical protein